MARVITLKCWPAPFEAVRRREKWHEVRVDDRDYQVGDVLVLQWWNPDTKQYNGEMESRRVTYITAGGVFGLPRNICVMSLALVTSDDDACRTQFLAEQVSDAFDTMVNIAERASAYPLPYERDELRDQYQDARRLFDTAIRTLRSRLTLATALAEAAASFNQCGPFEEPDGTPTPDDTPFGYRALTIGDFRRLQQALAAFRGGNG